MRRPHSWRIPISALRQGPNRLTFDLDIAEVGGEEHEVAENPLFDRLVGPLKVELDITRTGRRFLVNGVVRFRARLACAVCGREFVGEYAEPLQTEFLGEGEVPPPDGKVLAGKEVEYLRFKDEALDLGPLVRDAVHLAVPIAPTCRPDCRGACPTCGQDLNQATCDCAKPTESPFAGLKKLVE
ncbi:MAG TPA: DUF177 domain-containing protein [candidate division WOR-3 bacterium]|uniref:DUF177 domain-containing protein n=1 Tax=candidate division WOR-3 bacterium TaxID=2052148 RepID=A0A7V0T3S9_UNCW3|nr:DUF177 domain-containing protein [candidate division WOR-3 bacterium]